MQIAVPIDEHIQNVTSTDVHCIQRHSRCFAYGVGVVGGVTNYALLISKCSRSPPESSGAEVGGKREPNRAEIAFCYACSIYPSRNRPGVSLRIHGTRDTFHGAGHPRHIARQGASPWRAADVITYIRSGVAAWTSRSETIRTHGAVPPCQLTIYACDRRTADESNHGDTRGGHAGRGGAATRRSPCFWSVVIQVAH